MSHIPDCFLILLSFSKMYYTTLLIEAFDLKMKVMDTQSKHGPMFMHAAF